mgnify:CR=1 FL=1
MFHRLMRRLWIPQITDRVDTPAAGRFDRFLDCHEHIRRARHQSHGIPFPGQDRGDALADAFAGPRDDNFHEILQVTRKSLYF